MALRRWNVRAVTALAAICGALTSPAGAATNLVQNPGFELGSGGGWVDSGFGAGGAGVGGIVPQSGALMARTSCSPNPTLACGIFQDLQTVTGKAYTLKFGFNPGGGQDQFPGFDYVRLQVEWGGNVIADLGGGPLGWTDYVFPALIATTGATKIGFRGYAAVMSGIDNVSVVENESAVPEPTGWALMIGGLSLVGIALRRRMTVAGSRSTFPLHQPRHYVR
jgi:hypothetical protein